MSDLIDFASPVCPNPKTNGLKLPSPLIPAPTSKNSNDNNVDSCDLSGAVSNEQCRFPNFSPNNRRSFENNPFDVILKQVTEYERNKEDPFERLLVAEVADAESKLGQDKLQLKSETAAVDVATVAETCNSVHIIEEERNMSIITDLNNTNLIDDQLVEKTDLNFGNKLPEDCDNNRESKIPSINILSPCSNPANLSILNNSSMNDSLLGSEMLDLNNVKNAKTDKTQSHYRSVSQSDYLSVDKLSPRGKGKRSESVTDSLKNSVFGENSSLSSLCQSSISGDPMNNAFRISTLVDSDSSIKDKFERSNSNNSVFSGLSNISSISIDSSNKWKLERFGSESSTSGISNLSIIPSNTTSLSSSDVSLFSNSTMNKAFVANGSQSDSVSFVNNAENDISQKVNDKSDLIKKFYEIKKRMSCQLEPANNENTEESLKETKCSLLKSDKENSPKQTTEKLVDINCSSNSVFSDPEVDDIIVNEAKVLAETLEKLASSGESNCGEPNSTADDNLLFSKIELNFDDLPPSDDEAVDNLIDLPTSPQKSMCTEKVEKINAEQNSAEASIKDNAKVLESEFISETDSDTKAVAISLLLDLQKILNKENNPEAGKVLDDLQKILGVKCDDNTEILRNCLQDLKGSNQNENQIESDLCAQNSNIDCDKNNDCIGYDQDKISSVSQSLIIDNKNHEKTETEKEAEKTETKETILLSNLKKIIHNKDENDIADFLNNMDSILSMAAELRSKNSVTCETKLLSKLANTSYSSKSLDDKSQNKSLRVSSQYKKNLSNKVLNLSNRDVSSAKDEKKSYLLSSRRFSSDQNLSDKKKIGNIIESKKSHLSTANTATESIKSGFKKKTDIVIKKGPLKAMIPVGNMQRQGSTDKRTPVQVTVTPPKSVSTPLNIASSTPNSSRGSRIAKSNPKASSTPNSERSKKPEGTLERRRIYSLQRSFKSSSADNLSSLSSSLRRSDSFNTNKRLDQTLSPQKKLQTPKKNAESGTESRLPRYSPRPVKMRNYSFGDIRTVDNHKSPKKLTPKILTDKKVKRSTVLSPLRNLNKLEQKSMHMVSLGRSSIPTGPGKENYM